MISNTNVDFIVVSITIALLQFLADSAGYFWQPKELKFLANPDYKNLKHLQNLGHFSLTAAGISIYIVTHMALIIIN